MNVERIWRKEAGKRKANEFRKDRMIRNWRMRWWRFIDVRNRRGYLNTFQHLLTPWELLLLGAFVALPGLAIVQWLWGKL